jgi:hypothetical protein
MSGVQLGGGLGRGERLVMDGQTSIEPKREDMAEEEPMLVSPPTQEMAHHVADYSNFTRLFKWGAIVCFVTGFLWLMIVKAYW